MAPNSLLNRAPRAVRDIAELLYHYEYKSGEPILLMTPERFHDEVRRMAAALGCESVVLRQPYWATFHFDRPHVEGQVSLWEFGPGDHYWPNPFRAWSSKEFYYSHRWNCPHLSEDELARRGFCLDNDPDFPYFFRTEEKAQVNLTSHEQMAAWQEYQHHLNRLCTVHSEVFGLASQAALFSVPDQSIS